MGGEEIREESKGSRIQDAERVQPPSAATRTDIVGQGAPVSYGEVAEMWPCQCIKRGDAAIVPGWSLCNYHRGYDAVVRSVAAGRLTANEEGR